ASAVTGRSSSAAAVAIHFVLIMASGIPLLPLPDSSLTLRNWRKCVRRVTSGRASPRLGLELSKWPVVPALCHVVLHHPRSAYGRGGAFRSGSSSWTRRVPIYELVPPQLCGGSASLRRRSSVHGVAPLNG